MLKRVLRSLLRVGTLRAQYSKCHSRHFFISSTRGTSGHWKDDVVEPERDSQRLYNNTRARGCACILYYLATVKAFYRVSVSPNSRRRLFWWIYPPKLSNMIMSSSTPNEWSKSSTVFDSSEVACKMKLACEFGLPHFLLSPKIKNFRGPRLIGTAAAQLPWKRQCLTSYTH